MGFTYIEVLTGNIGLSGRPRDQATQASGVAIALEGGILCRLKSHSKNF